MQGIILVDKPSGWTSFDAVNYVRRQAALALGKRPKHVKTGHTGTLDPFATGLLILLIGKEYTRKAAELTKLGKTYEISAILGQRSSTGDPEGEIRRVSDNPPGLDEIESALDRFRGEIEQTPPVYSAVKIGGQRAYKLARAGKDVALEPRKVTVSQLSVTGYKYPELKLVAEVSSGTYVRSLIDDLGKALGTGAYTAGLRRTAIGSFAVKDAVPVKDINPGNIADLLQKLNSRDA